MLRLPSLAEVIGLFTTPTRVAHAVSGIERAATQAGRFIVYADKRRAVLNNQSVWHADAAQRARDQANGYGDEAARAFRIAGRLSELVA